MNGFSTPTAEWFSSVFPAPTVAQEHGWESIRNGDHTLILAPTGSGKTLAAFLWALDRLLTSPVPEPDQRLRILYVSPLKALTYDIERNLRAPLTGIALAAERNGVATSAVRVGMRTGDTPARERQELRRKPPDILVTTPESLYLLLTSESRSALRSVDCVIVDEIHSVAGTKRGSHLSLSLERLEREVRIARPQARVQRIGLSATQRPLETIARFLGGRERANAAVPWTDRPVSIVDAGTRKPLELKITVPVEDMGELGKPPTDDALVMRGSADADPEVRASIWPSIHPVLLDLIKQHNSTLVFVNSRRLAERLAARLNELAGEELVRSHHGSIAREQRLEVEDALKAGKLPALVATSSLELGIDMGAIDLVVQVEAPPSVASGMQRIGRAGHRVGEPSRGHIFPKFRGDLVVAAVVAQRMKEGLIETTSVPRHPLDVLAQQIVAMIATDEMTVDELEDVVGASTSFADLSRELLEGVLDMLSGRYPSDEFAELRPRINWDRATGLLTARRGAKLLAITSGGTIPDRGLYGVFTPEGSRVGELDEEMVYESRVGEVFLLGASSWKIAEITRDRVVVLPAPGEPGKMPFWHGDLVGRPVELGRAVGEFVRNVDKVSDETMADDYCLDDLAIRNLRQYIHEEREATGGVAPTDRQIVVERFRDELGDWRIAVLSPFGARVHAPWALALETKVRDELGFDVQAIWSDDGIVLRLPETDEIPSTDVVALDPDEVEDLVVNALGGSALFASRFRENAARALLLPRRRPGSRTPLWQQRQRAADLLAVAANHASFPILLETYRECLRDLFDVPALVELLSDIRGRKVRLTSVETPVPSPFASSLAFAYIASFMYEGDSPLAERRAQALTLDRRMLSELLGSDELRELLDTSAIDDLEAELQSLLPDRWVRDVDEAHDLLLRIGDLSVPELRARSTADFSDELLASRRVAEVRVAGEARLIAVEDAARYRDALGTAIPVGVPDAFLESVPDALEQLIRRYARSHGPFTSAEAADRFGLPVARVEGALAALVDRGQVERGAFRPSGTEREWITPDNLRRVRQRSLAVLRKEVEPVAPDAFARFLPAWQGIGSERRGLDRAMEAVAQLQGAAIPASVLERDVLSARVRDYSPRLLDDLLTSGQVMWVGAGSIGRDDGRVRLLLRSQAAELTGVWSTDSERPDGAEHDRLRKQLEERGACFFPDLRGVDDGVTLDALWDLVWAGEVTNDSFAAVRALSARKTSGGPARGGRPRLSALTAMGPPRAAGRWSLVSVDTVTPSTSRAHLLTTALLERHGVVTREAVAAEGVRGGFGSVYPMLRAMEESGAVRRGYFIAGSGVLQFAVPGAVDRLRSHRETPKEPYAQLLAATDPANPYGVTLPWPERGPQRAAGAFVVLVDGVASLYVERGGRGLVALRDLDGSWERAAVGALAQLLANGRFRRIVVNKIPGGLEQYLLETGFVPTPRGLTRYA